MRKLTGTSSCKTVVMFYILTPTWPTSTWIPKKKLISGPSCHRVPRRIAQGLIGIVDLSDLLFRRLGSRGGRFFSLGQRLGVRIKHLLVGGWATPLKNMTSSFGMISNPIYGKMKNGNQTTNQSWFCESRRKRCFWRWMFEQIMTNLPSPSAVCCLSCDADDARASRFCGCLSGCHCRTNFLRFADGPVVMRFHANGEMDIDLHSVYSHPEVKRIWMNMECSNVCPFHSGFVQWCFTYAHFTQDLFNDASWNGGSHFKWFITGNPNLIAGWFYWGYPHDYGNLQRCHLLNSRMATVNQPYFLRCLVQDGPIDLLDRILIDLSLHLSQEDHSDCWWIARLVGNVSVLLNRPMSNDDAKTARSLLTHVHVYLMAWSITFSLPHIFQNMNNESLFDSAILSCLECTPQIGCGK